MSIDNTLRQWITHAPKNQLREALLLALGDSTPQIRDKVLSVASTTVQPSELFST